MTKFNTSCVIIIGFLNCGDVVYFVGPGVVWTGSVTSSKIIVSSYTDGLSNVVPLCLLVSKISFYISILSTGALNVSWNLGDCLCLTLSE